MSNPGDQKRVWAKQLRGQNVIEYMLLVVTVVLVMFLFSNHKSSPMKNALDSILNDTVNSIANLNSELKFNASP